MARAALAILTTSGVLSPSGCSYSIALLSVIDAILSCCCLCPAVACLFDTHEIGVVEFFRFSDLQGGLFDVTTIRVTVAGCELSLSRVTGADVAKVVVGVSCGDGSGTDIVSSMSLC